MITMPADPRRREYALSILRFFHDEKIPTQQMMDSINLLQHILSNSSAEILQKASQPLRVIRNYCQRMLNMTNGVLDGSSLLLNMNTIKKRRHNLVELLRSACADNASAAMERGIGLRFRCDIQQLYGYVDADMLRRIMLNLLSNAFKHIGKCGVVEVCLERRDERSVLLSVTDSGSGIPSEVIDRIFDRFVTADGDPFSGIGLGLNNVKTMVALHDGTIRCNSAFGQGTKMEIVLPIPCQRVRVNSSFALNPCKSNVRANRPRDEIVKNTREY